MASEAKHQAVKDFSTPNLSKTSQVLESSYQEALLEDIIRWITDMAWGGWW